ncbi:MAG TPA: hypothetical protein VI795_03920 [Patescibacteria group bacterium]|nr:hypothetical protein [Patescibacteria group bacterium]
MKKLLKNKNSKIAGLIILVVGIVAGIVLIQQSQDIRERASDCLSDGSSCTANGCPGLCGPCTDGLCCADIADDCPAIDKGCKPPRYLQNGKCIGSPGKGILVGQYISKNKCKTDDDCAEGKHCLMGIVCVK